MLNKRLMLLSAFIPLVGCGGNSTTETPTAQLTEVPELNQISMALTPLKSANSADFEKHLRNGVYLNSSQQYFTLESANSDAIGSTDASTTAVSSSGETTRQGEFSTTITQEAGVDEGDRIKYDGEYIYIANNQYYQNQTFAPEEQTSETSVRILKRDSQGEVSELSNTVVGENASSINSMYLSDSKVAVLSNIYNYSIYNNPAATSIAIDLFFPVEQNFKLSLLDVSNQVDPVLTTSYTMDGSIIDSRRVDNILYIVSSYSPYVSDLNYATTEAEKLDNYKSIFSSNIDSLLPQITDVQGNTQNLVEPENCYLPANTTDKDGFNGIVTLTTVDLNEPDNITSICINTQISGLYATPSSIYLYGTDYQYENGSSIETSIIHKFSIDEQTIDYAASGTLDGRFNWSLSNLRFSESGNNLRVVTTKGNRSEGYDHKLNVLSPEGNELTLIAQLPNDTYPEKIGKLNGKGIVQEDIKSVRFFENKAYIVTFLNTDPLYVIDTSDINDLKIDGALEIPGYSSYLHPLSDNLLVGIGQNVDPARVSLNDEEATSTPIIEGAKISLFDVSNINNPLEIHSIVYENGYTPVEYDYHALTYLKMADNTHRFGLPVEKWLTDNIIDSETGKRFDVWKRENSLQLIEVTGNDTNANLVDKGSVESGISTNNNYISGWDDRAIFHDDDIYYLHGNSIWRSYWQTPELTTGPF